MSAGRDETTNGTPEDGRGGVASPDEDIVAQVMAAAEQVATLDDECRLLLLSILTGDDDLQAELTGKAADRTAGRMLKAPAKEPVGAYLKSITVAGFRGIGPEARLDLHPAPGVVVVAGRNGSGKSTFSEAVEVALTRTSYRWEAKKGASGWRAGWRNLHVSDPCHIRVELAEEGVGTTTVAADLAEATKEPCDGAFWVQQAGRQRDSSLDPLGWVRPLELYRPLLSYDELGGILDAPPSQLYEKLSTILGLGRIATAQERLDELVKSATAPRREAKAQLARLREALAASQDPRAAEAAQLLADRVPDTEALERLATGAIGPPSGDMAILRELAALTVPTVEQVQAAVTEAEEAQHALAALSGDAAEALTRRTELLRHALAHVDEKGAQPCPLCGVGTLDAAWAEQARQEISELDEQAGELQGANRAYDAALQRLGALLPPAPRSLDAPLDVDVPSRAEVAAAWRAIQEIDVTSPDALAGYWMAPVLSFPWSRSCGGTPTLSDSAGRTSGRRWLVT